MVPHMVLVSVCNIAIREIYFFILLVVVLFSGENVAIEPYNLFRKCGKYLYVVTAKDGFWIPVVSSLLGQYLADNRT